MEVITIYNDDQGSISPAYSDNDGPGGIDGAFTNFANAIIENAAIEYSNTLTELLKVPSESEQNELKKSKEKIESFFYSDWFSFLTDCDPEIIISGIRRNVKQQVKEDLEKQKRAKEQEQRKQLRDQKLQKQFGIQTTPLLEANPAAGTTAAHKPAVGQNVSDDSNTEPPVKTVHRLAHNKRRKNNSTDIDKKSDGEKNVNKRHKHNFYKQ